MLKRALFLALAGFLALAVFQIAGKNGATVTKGQTSPTDNNLRLYVKFVNPQDGRIFGGKDCPATNPQLNSSPKLTFYEHNGMREVSEFQTDDRCGKIDVAVNPGTNYDVRVYYEHEPGRSYEAMFGNPVNETELILPDGIPDSGRSFLTIKFKLLNRENSAPLANHIITYSDKNWTCITDENGECTGYMEKPPWPRSMGGPCTFVLNETDFLSRLKKLIVPPVQACLGGVAIRINQVINNNWRLIPNDNLSTSDQRGGKIDNRDNDYNSRYFGYLYFTLNDNSGANDDPNANNFTILVGPGGTTSDQPLPPDAFADGDRTEGGTGGTGGTGGGHAAAAPAKPIVSLPAGQPAPNPDESAVVLVKINVYGRTEGGRLVPLSQNAPIDVIVAHNTVSGTTSETASEEKFYSLATIMAAPIPFLLNNSYTIGAKTKFEVKPKPENIGTITITDIYNYNLPLHNEIDIEME